MSKPKPKYQVGEKVLVFRRGRHWWNSGMTTRLVGKTFTIQQVSIPIDINERIAYVIDGYFVSADCLRKVEE